MAEHYQKKMSYRGRQCNCWCNRPASAKPVIIEDDVMIGANAVILEGVHIGKHAVVGAGAVVLEDVEENCVVAGCPAKVLKRKDIQTIHKTSIQQDLRNL